MDNVYLVGKFAGNPRGKRLQRSVAAVAIETLPAGSGLCLSSGQDYQTATPNQQRLSLDWASRPGCTFLLVPPFQTGTRHDPRNWEVSRLSNTPALDAKAHPVLRLTQPEINASLTHGLSPTGNPLIDGGTSLQLSGLYRKHPASGVFGVTTVPVWSLALADNVPALEEWLRAWRALAGVPTEEEEAKPTGVFQPTQRHFSVLLYLASGEFKDRSDALAALAWNETFDLEGVNVTGLLDALEAAGFVAGGTLTEKGQTALLESPYRTYAEAYLKTR